MTKKFCGKQSDDAANPCVLEVNHSGGCVSALFWCQIHRRPKPDEEFCLACMADDIRSLLMRESGGEEHSGKLSKLESALGGHLVEHQRLDDKLGDVVTRLNAHNRRHHQSEDWIRKTNSQLAALQAPLGETLRKTIAQRLVVLARRMWADIPF